MPTYLCTQCGEQVPMGARWCRSCGAPTGSIHSSMEGEDAVAVADSVGLSRTSEAAAGLPTTTSGEIRGKLDARGRSVRKATVTTFGLPTKILLTVLLFVPFLVLARVFTAFARALGTNLIWALFAFLVGVMVFLASGFLRHMWTPGVLDVEEKDVPPVPLGGTPDG